MPRRFRLRDLLIALAAVGLLSAWGVQILAARRWESRQVACASNLRSLWGTQFNYAAQYGRPNGTMPTAVGGNFWLKLQQTPKPLIDRYEPFFCPIAGERPGWGRTSYRGPASDVNAAGDLDPIAADKEGNHGRDRGGNVLVQMGDVSHYEETDPIWIRARITTKE